jgi:hypothetical protein
MTAKIADDVHGAAALVGGTLSVSTTLLGRPSLGVTVVPAHALTEDATVKGVVRGRHVDGVASEGGGMGRGGCSGRESGHRTKVGGRR